MQVPPGLLQIWPSLIQYYMILACRICVVRSMGIGARASDRLLCSEYMQHYQMMGSWRLARQSSIGLHGFHQSRSTCCQDIPGTSSIWIQCYLSSISRPTCQRHCHPTEAIPGCHSSSVTASASTQSRIISQLQRNELVPSLALYMCQQG